MASTLVESSVAPGQNVSTGKGMIRGRMVDMCQCMPCQQKMPNVSQSVTSSGTQSVEPDLRSTLAMRKRTPLFGWHLLVAGVMDGLLPSRSRPFTLKPSEAEDNNPALAVLFRGSPLGHMSAWRLRNGG